GAEWDRSRSRTWSWPDHCAPDCCAALRQGRPGECSGTRFDLLVHPTDSENLMCRVTSVPGDEFRLTQCAQDPIPFPLQPCTLRYATASATLLAPTIIDPQGVLGTTLGRDRHLLVKTEIGGAVIIRYATETGWQMAACHIANRNLTKAKWAQSFPGGS